MAEGSSLAPQRLTAKHWLIVCIAAIGFAFDIYELLMLPLIVRPALLELVNAKPGTPEFEHWVGMLFFIPAIAGGIFGLIGGYLTDLLGRRRVLVWSILLYAFSAFAAGFSTSVEMLLVLRCTTFIGVCVEFVAAVAWLAELFPHPKQRETVLGYTQAFSSLGGLLVAQANALAVVWAANLPAIVLPDWLASWLGPIHDPHNAWRYTLMSGVVPALPLILIRPFLPESPVWQEQRARGTLKRPSLLAIFAPQYLQTTIVTTIMFALSYGAAFGAIQHLPRIVPGLSQVEEQVSEATKNVPPEKKRAEQAKVEQSVAAQVQTVQEIGGLTGRICLAILVVRILSRRSLLRIFLIPGLIVVPLVFFYPAVHDLQLLYIGIFLAGLLTVGQFSFWGNYLPLMYPVHLRGTGESFAANVGGRMIGTSFAWGTTTLASRDFIPGGDAPTRLAYVAAGIALFVYAGGLLMSFWLPEPKQETLPD